MRNLTVAALASCCLLSLPALAQTNSSASGSNSTAAQSATLSPGDMQKLQTKITNDLKTDGYTNIRVMPNSFLVHAVNKHNDPVMMIINPDSVFAVTQLPPGQAGSAEHNSTEHSSTTKQ